MHQRSNPGQKTTKEFYDTAGGIENSFKQRSRHTTHPSIDVDVATSVDRQPEFGRRAFDFNGTRRFYWEEKDQYGVYKDDQGYARDLYGSTISVHINDIKRLLERASKDEPAYICLPKHVSSFTQTKLVPEIYTKDEINEMFYGVCGEHERNKEAFQIKLDGVYYPLNDSISWLTTCMEEMKQDIARLQNATDDPWISCDTPTIPFGPPTLMSINLRVSDLLCPLSNDWDLGKVRAVLQHYEDEILSLIASSAPSRDRLAWLPDKSGLYTTRLGDRVGMNLLRSPEMQTPPQDPATHSPFDWLKNIWNIHTAPKIKDFLWRVARKAIPVSENHASSGITPFFCKSCSGIEDDLHVFLHCAAQARNKRCFEDRTYSATEIVSKAVSDAREWQDSQTHFAEDISLAHNRLAPHPPLRVNTSGPTCHVDAAWDARSGMCGLGGLFSGSPTRTRLPRISATRSLVSSALMAEAPAICLAVMTAAFSNIKTVAILSDSLTLIKMLKQKETRL
ncbi:hypothetical protein F2Q69_00052693 [Brassica cretica]|uniref:Reverse transcriptase zinc-binding domain-containing protein n=1 Tax=Brassica cretica TaxID=69181 RepID=A0A8S9MR14_BRACR|nr:hypothetical protein F2Q69_00052693 [Brassica cretica]